jgi:hypothetical protein
VRREKRREKRERRLLCAERVNAENGEKAKAQSRRGKRR